MKKKKSLVIIGGGITGLSAGIAYAKSVDKSEKSVLIIEKQPVIGGYVTSFRRKGYLFDTSQMIPESSDLFEFLGIDMKLKKFTGYFMRLFIANPKNNTIEKIEIPSGYDNCKDYLKHEFPNQSPEIDKFMNTTRAMYRELFGLKVEPNCIDLVKTLVKCPNIIKYKDFTFKEYYQSFGIRDNRLCEILDSFAAFSGLPSDRVAALMTVGAINTTLDGAYRTQKGFVELPVKMRKRFLELGGEIITRHSVTEILTESGKAFGVKLDNGEVIFADDVITTIDPKVAMGKLVGFDKIKKIDKSYSDKVEKMKMSVSAFSINLGLDDSIDLAGLGFDCGYNILTTGKDTFGKLFESYDRGELTLSDKCFHLAAICPSLTTGGKQVLTIRVVPAPIADWVELRNSDYDSYMKRKEEISLFYIGLVEKYMIPGLAKHIVVKDISTPATFARYSGSPTGSNYDMAPYTDNFGKKRLKMRTPIKHLYQPKFSHGIWPSLQGGLQVVDMILCGKIMSGYARYRKPTT